MTENERQKLDDSIQKCELEKALKNMANNKSPGQDGLITEFYKQYWDVIGDDFTKLVQEIYDTGQLSNSQRKGVITLLYKQGEREAIENWRPITLLNIDYKIIAKTLAERLKEVLPNLIHPDQKGFIKGRKIDHGVRLIQDVISYYESNNEGGAIIFLYQKKAFDRVEMDKHPVWKR